ncbi:hypothetical protein N431DRAFT_367318 [Stipitochalara longipes BDJ]|nr:hypothetical protein N431DRAFT_367318 [Stipitochalara longipes BDJ]
MPAEGPPKKQISDRRRMQNKQAQKNYRERQKRNLQVLQDIATSTHNFRVDCADKDHQDVVPGAGLSTDASPTVDSIYSTSFTLSHLPVFSGRGSTANSLIESAPPPNNFLDTNQQLRSVPTSLPKDLNEISVIGRLLEEAGLDLDQQTKLQLLDGKINLKNILEAGIKALSQEIASETTDSWSHGYEDGSSARGIKLRTDRILKLQNVNAEYTAPLPDPRQNHFRMKQVLFIAACAANASILGVDLGLGQSNDCENVETPFFRDSITESAAKAACLSEFTALKTHLRPTATQLLHNHHPYIDVLPFPTFRDRLIKLAYAEEPMIDEDDLCEDLQKDGLICWGSSLGGGSAAMGSGAPWDIRSWEAQPWFLKKWWILIGGAEGEIYKQTQWWCEMRGEKSCYPW